MPASKNPEAQDVFDLFKDCDISIEELSLSDEEYERFSAYLPPKNTDEKQCPYANLDTQYLMQLNLEGISCPEIVRKLPGKLRHDSTGVYFFKDKEDEEFEIPAADVAKGLLPLIDYLEQERLQVRLSGAFSGNLFHVYDIVPLPASRPGASKSPGRAQFTHVIRTLLANRFDVKAEPAQRPVMFTTQSELALYVETCGHTLPPGMAAWARQCLASLKTSGTSRDEDRHLLRALTYAINIDWDSPKQTLPSMDWVQSLLDARFYGLASVKERILEVFAQIKKTGTVPAWGILLNGPAGVGKTTIAKAIAEIFGRPMVNIDMSTTGDSEALTGTSRIYSNAKPGAILEALYMHRSANVVVVINELDKAVSRESKGNPADAMLTLLDGLSFTDNYLEAAIPTQGMFFVATCNDLGKISKPLLDRLLQIDIPAYTRAEKRVILTDYILPWQTQRLGIEPLDFSITDDAISLICGEYALEPGVRDLQQYAEKILSHYLLQCEKSGPHPCQYGIGEVVQLLGPSHGHTCTLVPHPGQIHSMFHFDGQAHDLVVQATVRMGSGKLDIIGLSADVHKGHCRAAYECLRLSTGLLLEKTDVTLFIHKDFPPVPHNYIGLAALAAMISAVKGVIVPAGHVFIGGCDLLGNTYFSGTTLLPYITKMAEQGQQVLCAPLGCRELMLNTWDSGDIIIVEAITAPLLIQTAFQSLPSVHKRDKGLGQLGDRL